MELIKKVFNNEIKFIIEDKSLTFQLGKKRFILQFNEDGEIEFRTTLFLKRPDEEDTPTLSG